VNACINNTLTRSNPDTSKQYVKIYIYNNMFICTNVEVKKK